MACKIIWSSASRHDLRDIVRFIARGSERLKDFRNVSPVLGQSLSGVVANRVEWVAGAFDSH
jgi:hypothetical protein